MNRKNGELTRAQRSMISLDGVIAHDIQLIRGNFSPFLLSQYVARTSYIVMALIRVLGVCTSECRGGPAEPVTDHALGGVHQDLTLITVHSVIRCTSD